MEGQDDINRLDFQDDGTLHQEVQAQWILEKDSLVAEGNHYLALDSEALGLKLIDKSGFVDAFQKSWPKLQVDPDPSIYNLAGHRFYIIPKIQHV